MDVTIEREPVVATAAPAEAVEQEAGAEHNPAACSRVAPILQRIGDKWSILIVMTLASGPRRFNELKRQIGGISQRMLTLALRGLERDGLVSRSVTPTIPPRVDYALTELGMSLRAPMMTIGAWANEHYDTIQTARARFDLRSEGE
jgi:DNA-binding HxlR family transcriptional regulator